MIPALFEYAAPESLAEAISLLQNQPNGRLLAGGLDLLTEMKLRRAEPALLVDLRKLDGLRGIQPWGDGLRIGALTTCAELAGHATVQQQYRVLAEAADSVGDVQVRNMSTLGGNLATADPAGDLAAAVLALGAVLQVNGPDGERAILADQFFVGAFTTSLTRSELITSFDLPAAPRRRGSAYVKIKNPANNYPLCGVAASIALSDAGTLSVCRVAVTGVTVHPRRLLALEQALKNQAPTDDMLRGAYAKAVEGLPFITDMFGSAEYRSHLTTVLTEQALSLALSRAQAA